MELGLSEGDALWVAGAREFSPEDMKVVTWTALETSLVPHIEQGISSEIAQLSHFKMFKKYAQNKIKLKHTE